jgi:hypothetical protein
MATMKVVTEGDPPSSACRSEPDGPERQPDGRRLIANRPSSAAVKCTYGPRIRASFHKLYGLVHKTEQPAAARRDPVLRGRLVPQTSASGAVASPKAGGETPIFSMIER